MRTIKSLSILALVLVAFVACNKPASEQTETIVLTTPATIDIPGEGAETAITFKASGSWAASFAGGQRPDWLSMAPQKGVGDGSISLTAQANASDAIRSATIRIFCGASSAEVTVTQDYYHTSVILHEDMDHNPSYAGYMSDDPSWHNATGEGVANIGYECFNAKIRNDGSADAYAGASGKCYGNLTQASSGNMGYLTISGIATGAHRDFALSFGAAQGPEVLKVEVSPAGKGWTALEYNFSKAYGQWDLVKTTFTLRSDAEFINLRFTLTGPKATYANGAKIDDITLETLSGTAANVVSAKWPYAELPQAQSSQDYYYSTLYTTTVSSKKHVRNYSFCYDTRRHNPIWVAFPMHAIYAEGSGRTDNAWGPYPDLPVDKQSIIWDITGDGYHQYWSNNSSLITGTTWGKGHLCMSSSRAGAGQEINKQTFYPVNIAPQTTREGADFSALWGKTEDFHYQSGTEICADTLYIVAGCHYENETNVEYDACYHSNTCEYSKQCIMPTHQYKLFLRTRSGNTGKAVQECSASELKAIGFWFDTMPEYGCSTDLADYALSIAEIERKTGITFFPDIPAEVKQQCNATDWRWK